MGGSATADRARNVKIQAEYYYTAVIYTRIYDREMAQLTFIDSGSNKRTSAFIADMHSCVYQIIQIYGSIFHGEIDALRRRTRY